MVGGCAADSAPGVRREYGVARKTEEQRDTTEWLKARTAKFEH